MCFFNLFIYRDGIYFCRLGFKNAFKFVEGKKKIGLENMNVRLYNESRKINSMYDCERPWKAGLITGLDEGGYAIMGHDITKIH